jgi:predicted ArsR family transcriptional regulator
MSTALTPACPGEQGILATLHAVGRASRAELSQLTGLPRATIASSVAALIERGLLSEDDATSSTARKGPGRRAASLRIARNTRTRTGETRQVGYGDHLLHLLHLLDLLTSPRRDPDPVPRESFTAP